MQNTQLDTNVTSFTTKHQHMTTDCEAVIEDYHTIIGTYFGTKPLVSPSTRAMLCFDMT